MSKAEREKFTSQKQSTAAIVSMVGINLQSASVVPLLASEAVSSKVNSQMSASSLITYQEKTLRKSYDCSLLRVINSLFSVKLNNVRIATMHATMPTE